MRRKKDKAQAAERSQAIALTRFKDKENFEVLKSIPTLENELALKHPTGAPMYTTAMKVEIVEKQIQYRRDCLMRKLRPGALCSGVKDLAREFEADP